MPYRLTLEATIQAESETEALRLMGDRLLKIAKDHPAPAGSGGNVGGFGYPMTFRVEVVPEREEQ